jgi:hypothetical protein
VKVEPEVVALQCNVCGEEGLKTGMSWPEDMHVFEVAGGYADSFPSDLETLTFVVHGKCLKAWADTFKVPVDSRHSMSPRSVPATHSETGKAVIFEYGWLRDAEQPFVFSEVANPYDFPGSDSLPPVGIYKHFKGLLYEVLDHGWDVNAPHDAYVIYRALYGESKVWARPARMWVEDIRSVEDKTTYPEDAPRPRFVRYAP